MSVHTITLSTTKIMALKKKLSTASVCKTPPYAVFQVKTSDCTITAYESGKVVFQGEGADFYVQGVSSSESKANIQQPKMPLTYPQHGSDEVGTGDYFGPIVVCACRVEEKDIPLLQSLKIQDSKQTTDDTIVAIAPILMDHLTHSFLLLDNAKYNEVHQVDNMNAIKAKLHNQAFIHLKEKVNNDMDTIIIDQFTPEKSYYQYLQKEKEVIKGIHFETKAENKYLSVACASIIARYAFIKAIEQMSKAYSFPFPKGAGAHVDEAAVRFVSVHSEQELWKVCKYHFKNTEKMKALML